MSDCTVNVIGAEPALPLNIIEGFEYPDEPKEAVLKLSCPDTPKPPDTLNAPVAEFVEAVPAVTAIPDTDNISVLGLNEKVLSFDNAAPETVPEAVENRSKCATFELPAATVFTFLPVVAKPVKLPTNPVAVRVPVDGTYDNEPLEDNPVPVVVDATPLNTG